MPEYLHKVSRQSLLRRVIVFSTPGKKITAKDKKQESKIVEQLSLLEKQIHHKINQLWTATSHRIPYVRLSVIPSYDSTSDLISSLRNQDSFLPPTRAYIALAPKNDRNSADFLATNEISHLVGINLNATEPGWSKAPGVTSVIVSASLRSTQYIVTDLALDIAMFHALISPSQINQMSVTEKQHFSKEKVSFALENGYGTIYGPIRSASVEYVPFASICRTRMSEDGLDISKYIRIWTDFISARNTLNLQATETPISHDDIIQDLRLYHRQFGSLKLASIKKALVSLGPPRGVTYLLATTHKRPHRTAVRNQIAIVFGRKRWKKGLIKVVKFEELNIFQPWTIYLFFFKFTW